MARTRAGGARSGRAGATGRAVLVLSLLAAPTACAAGGPAPVPGRAVPPRAAAGAGTLGADATTTPGAELRAGLTWLLVERVHLLAQARTSLLASPDGRGAPAVRTAETLLRAGAEELARTTGVPPADLLPALQQEADVVLALRVDGTALSAAHARAAQVLGDAAALPARGPLTEQLDRSTARLAAGRPQPDTAAAAVAAGLLANALAAARAVGSTETPAVVLRADLVRLLVDRAYAVGVRADDPDLDRLAETLARRLVSGRQHATVLAALRAGHAALHAAARAGVARDAAGTARARQALLGADRDLAALLAVAVPALPASLVLTELDPARGPLVVAAVARTAGTPDAPRLSSAAARRALVTAAVLAAGLAEQTRMA